MRDPGLLRVLAVRSDSAGDVLLTGPAVRALPQLGEVTMLCGLFGAPVADVLPGVRTVLTVDAPWIADDPGSLLDVRLRSDRLDGDRVPHEVERSLARRSWPVPGRPCPDVEAAAGVAAIAELAARTETVGSAC